MNCKPGDMAIVTKAMLPENIGRIVEILGPYGDHPLLGFRWRIRFQSPARSVSSWDLKTVLLTDVLGATPDAWLKPVSGLPIDEDVTEDLKESA